MIKQDSIETVSQEKYYVAKYFLNGFEAVLLFHGERDLVAQYIASTLGDQVMCKEVSDELATNLFNIGFKVYMVPNSKQFTTE